MSSAYSNYTAGADERGGAFPAGPSLVQSIEPNYWSLLLLVLPLSTALGNLLVIQSVWGEKVLRTSTNFLIVSLAVADLLVALLVMPWGIYVLVSCHSS